MANFAYLPQWTEWRPLLRASRDLEIPRSPGLYRIRRVGRRDLDYVGETGRSLRERLGMLRGIYSEEMPYNDPHTAGPALWALRQESGCEFEASVAPVKGSRQWRKGLEAVAIGLYRQEYGRSPTVEFGRMLPGYRPSCGGDAKKESAHLRPRGGRSKDPHERHLLGIPPVGSLKGDPQGERWGGHAWSPWSSLAELSARSGAGGSGLYRIRGTEYRWLLYVGEGRIRPRLTHHRQSARNLGNRQAAILAAQDRLECSWVVGGWLDHQRLELENDLIAAHVLETGSVPSAQFLGQSQFAED